MVLCVVFSVSRFKTLTHYPKRRERRPTCPRMRAPNSRYRGTRGVERCFLKGATLLSATAGVAMPMLFLLMGRQFNKVRRRSALAALLVALGAVPPRWQSVPQGGRVPIQESQRRWEDLGQLSPRRSAAAAAA